MYKRIFAFVLMAMLSTPSFAGIYDKWQAYVPETLAGLGKHGMVSGGDAPGNSAGFDYSTLSQQYLEGQYRGAGDKIVTLEFSYGGQGLWKDELAGFKAIAPSVPNISIINVQGFPAVLSQSPDTGDLIVYLSAYTKILINAVGYSRTPDILKFTESLDLKGIKASAK